MTDITQTNLYNMYNELQNIINTFRTSLYTLWHDELASKMPTIYVAMPDMKQYWFMKYESGALVNDSKGYYAINAKGRGVRAYFNSPITPSQLINSVNLMGTSKPSSFADIIAGTPSLVRYEVFGTVSVNVSPSSISFPDLIRNSTIKNQDDYLIGEIPYPHFIGNFAKWASYIVDCNNTASMAPNT